MKPKASRIQGRCGQCGGKLIFRTVGDAHRFIRDRARAGDDDFLAHNMVPYPCPHGLKYHIGHSRNGQPFVDERGTPP